MANGGDAPSRIVPLTDNSGGVAGDVIADVPAAYNEAALAAQIASLVAKVNEILTELREWRLVQ